MVEIDFDAIVFQEGKTYVAYTPTLDVSRCGDTVERAKDSLKTSVRLFLEEAGKMGTLEEIVEEAGYEPGDGKSRITSDRPVLVGRSISGCWNVFDIEVPYGFPDDALQVHLA